MIRFVCQQGIHSRWTSSCSAMIWIQKTRKLKRTERTSRVALTQKSKMKMRRTKMMTRAKTKASLLTMTTLVSAK